MDDTSRKPEPRGIWRESTGEKVEDDIAQTAWTTAARPILVDVAKKYGEFLTYKELAAGVQRDADIRTTQQIHRWIGTVLGTVAEDSAKNGEPLLSAFVVQADETVGAGYATSVQEAYGFTPEDPDEHAAEERLKAHVFFGAEIPADGGRPRLPPQVGRRRARARAAVPRVVRPMCPNCFVELPVNGPCGLCAE